MHVSIYIYLSKKVLLRYLINYLVSIYVPEQLLGPLLIRSESNNLSDEIPDVLHGLAKPA